MLNIALATCEDLPDLDEDGPLLIQHLAERSVIATAAVWDDPSVPWNAFHTVVLRSTWDYPAKWKSFLDWIDRIDQVTRLVNPAPAIRWNIDKRYLRNLSQSGVPVVPTHWIDAAALPLLPHGWKDQEIVVKPVISAGSRDTGRFRAGDEIGPATLVSRILSTDRPVMIQPYLNHVDVQGETAMMFFRGVFSHAIRKAPLLQVGDESEAGLFRPETIAPRKPSKDEFAVAEQVLRALPFHPHDLAFIRIDLVQDDNDHPCVIEVELIEPSLFLTYDPGATKRFARSLAEGLAS